MTVAFVQLRSPSGSEKNPDAVHPLTGRTTASWTSPEVKARRVGRACAIVDALTALASPPQIIVFSEYCVPLDNETLQIIQTKATEKNVIVIPGADNADDGPINYSYIVEPTGEPRPIKKLHPSAEEPWLDGFPDSTHPIFSWRSQGTTYYLAIRICWDFPPTKHDDLLTPTLVIAPMNSKDTFETHAQSLLRDVQGAAFILCNAVGGKATGSSCAVASLPSGNDGIVAKLPEDREGCGLVTVDMDHLVAPRRALHVVHRALQNDRRFLIRDVGTAVTLVPMPTSTLATIPESAAAADHLPTPHMPGILVGCDDARLIHDTGFVGRQEDVERLSGLVLHPRSSLLERLVVVTGEPGMGKTEVCKAALSCCLDRAADSLRIVWVDATRASTPSEFVGCFAAALGRTTISKAEDIVADFRNYPAIVYVDNLEDALSTDDAREANTGLLRDIITASRKPILATSRRGLPGQAHQVPLNPLPADDAVKVFVQSARDAGNEMPPPDDQNLREFLHTDLGNHPLALAVVGSHVGPGVEWTEVRERWRRSFREVAVVPGGAAHRNRNLEASIDLTFDKLAGGGGLARRLWAMLAYFPEGVAPDRLGPVLRASDAEIMTATDLLCRHSVARRQGAGSLRILPAMASYIRDATRQGKGGLNHRYFQTRLLDWFELLWKDVKSHRGTDKRRVAALDAFLANVHPILVLARDINANAMEIGT